MLRDRFDTTLWIGILAAVAALVWLLLTGPGGAAGGEGLDRALERELAARARLELLGKIYGPVNDLMGQGRDQQALLKLEELSRRYPGEAHGLALKGEILFRTGALEEAAASMAEAIRRDGDYLEADTPLSRRRIVAALVDEGQERLAARLRLDPGNAGAERALKDLYYLQSRLAGGCE